MLTLTIIPSGQESVNFSKVELSGNAGRGSILCKDLHQDLRVVSFDCSSLSNASLLRDVLVNCRQKQYSIFFLQATEGFVLRQDAGRFNPDTYMNAFFLNPHAGQNVEFLNDCRYSGFVIQFSEPWLRQWLRQRSEGSLFSLIEGLADRPEPFPAYTQVFLRILEHMQKTPELLLGEMSLLLGIDDLLLKFTEHLHFTRIRFREYAVREALLRLKSGISSAIAQQQQLIEKIAIELGLPVAILCQYFHRYFGVSLHRYCIDSKMQVAMGKRAEENLNMNELAVELGFDSRSTFSKSFAEYFGYTPTEYRRSFGRTS